MTTFSLTLSLWMAAASGRLAPPLAKEMADAVLAVDKALGLESWASHGVKSCVDRGGADNPAKEVSVEEARKCAASAVASGLPALGKSYVLAVLMAPIGPVTVVAFGIGDGAGWGAYSCDPGRKCPPMKMTPTSKWGKRLVDRQTKACGDATTIWLPENQRACAK